MNNALPAYHQIMQRIKGWIINREFGPGEKIPSENELATTFSVSRMTVHQAIGELVREGLIARRRGDGTFVTENESLINSLNLEFSGSMDELFFHQLLKTQMKSVTVRQTLPPRRVAEALGIGSKDEEATEITRLQLLGPNRLAYVVNYLPRHIGSRIPEADLYDRPLLTILTKDLGIRFTEATQTIEASFADRDVAEKLQMAAGLPILFVERVMYTRGHKPVEVYQSSYRGDANRFIFRLKNVRGKNGARWVQQRSGASWDG